MFPRGAPFKGFTPWVGSQQMFRLCKKGFRGKSYNSLLSFLAIAEEASVRTSYEHI
jgi:hypothetical protein